eukprot:scaffold329988_cov24-Prasinocladus_malaysianus.AAC.1
MQLPLSQHKTIARSSQMHQTFQGADQHERIKIEAERKVISKYGLAIILNINEESLALLKLEKAGGFPGAICVVRILHDGRPHPVIRAIAGARDAVGGAVLPVHWAVT